MKKINNSQHNVTMIPVDQLFFDPDNPRLPSNNRSDDEKTIIKWMLKNGDILELMSSIATTGFSNAEPLLVVENNGNYIVVEGNRRLAAVKLLKDPSLAMLRPKAVAEIANNATHNNISEIPAIIYDCRNDILDYLGYRHITGTKPWGPREKAEYLKQLYASHKNIDTSDKTILIYISQMIGTKPYYAKRLLETLAIVEMAEENAFWNSEYIDERIESNFSVFHTALSYENIRSYME